MVEMVEQFGFFRSVLQFRAGLHQNMFVGNSGAHPDLWDNSISKTKFLGGSWGSKFQPNESWIDTTNELQTV